jgi:taurine dioxygenase
MHLKEKITAIPHGSGVCADIAGFDFENYDAQDMAEVRRIWLQHGVLRFKRTRITDQQQVEFSRHFGEFVIHPKQKQEGGHSAHPEILVISNVGGALGNDEATWHTDTWFYETPPAASILRGVQVPKTGGNTYFVSMYDAYQTLPDALKTAVTGRQLFHQHVYDKKGALRLGRSAPRSKDFREWAGIVHPIVRTHGETGRKCLYIGGTAEGVWIVGMPLDESNEIVRGLWDHVGSMKRMFTQEWDAGDMVMWDNRCVMHRRDSLDPKETRIMHRTTTRGERPV